VTLLEINQMPAHARRKPQAELVRRLIATQFPQWAELPIAPVDLDGWDNTTFRLGDSMAVRLPSGPSYAAQVAKEHEWLPRLAPALPLPIPLPLAQGAPTAAFPLPWSVYRWIDGEVAQVAPIDDLPQFATAVASFLLALQRIDAIDGPSPGMHSAFRGCPLTLHRPQAPSNTPGNWGTREAIATLRHRIDASVATEVWDAALAATRRGPPVWVHGDIAPANLLVRAGCLAGVIDFGCSAVGDPACDLVIAWTFFAGESRAAFRAGLPLDDATWTRARGWALWKAVYVLAQTIDNDPEEAVEARRVLDEVLADQASPA
jgi:aminoglycoside phosphotransferase (APT) family kinase protein